MERNEKDIEFNTYFSNLSCFFFFFFQVNCIKNIFSLYTQTILVE